MPFRRRSLTAPSTWDDSATKSPATNRRGSSNRREYEYPIDRLARTNGTAMILMIDVDGFKNINDTYGHIEGDNALKAVAAILRNACSNHKDLGNIALYRYGGDEFLMISTDWNISQTKDL